MLQIVICLFTARRIKFLAPEGMPENMRNFYEIFAGQPERRGLTAKSVATEA
jgi:hypothetical protein